jgi:kynurenine formamidase
LFESHRVLFDKNVPALENVANVDAVPVTGATLFVFPMKIEGGSGGPARIAAFVPN